MWTVPSAVVVVPGPFVFLPGDAVKEFLQNCCIDSDVASVVMAATVSIRASMIQVVAFLWCVVVGGVPLVAPLAPVRGVVVVVVGVG